MEKFADILKDLIIEKGYSLRKIAQESKVSATQYSKYLRGTLPSVNVAIKISNYFNVSLDYLFGITNQPYKANFKSYDISSFVERYEKALKDSNISHWQFAKKFGLSESSLRRWKYKKDTPSLDSLIIISSNLSVSIDYLLNRK